MTRHRLRFLLQEFDLPPGETIIGRGPDCRITIVDPLVSRHHVRVFIDGDQVTIEDLSSRNGSRINGRTLRGTHVLRDGDRIRIGTQELVFSQVDSVALVTNKRQTGFLRYCAGCEIPLPDEMQSCPNCGSEEKTEEQTLSGVMDDRSRQNWALQLLIEMLDKAIIQQRAVDIDRILAQAMRNVEERLKAASPLDPEQIDAVSLAAVSVSRLVGSVKWTKWVLDVHRRMSRIPSCCVAEAVATLPPPDLGTLRPEVDALIRSAPVGKLGAREREGLDRLRTLRTALSADQVT